MAKTPPVRWCARSGLGALLVSTLPRAARRRLAAAGRPATSRSRSRAHRVAGALAVLTAPLVLAAPARANDAIFPAEGGAADRIGWDGNYFVVDGEPVVLSSAEIHYARVPRELWRDRLVKAKRAGMNTISTYSFWNAHELAEGVFDFTDNLDLDAWLSLIEELGMYAIVRPGPYNCAEWLSG
ncbi:MAG TPA: beta-galactosidase, partial [Polyangiaceae bacterium]|nr:beta-galactosidase [Polyangiaceae bacterium]